MRQNSSQQLNIQQSIIYILENLKTPQKPLHFGDVFYTLVRDHRLKAI